MSALRIRHLIVFVLLGIAVAGAQMFGSSNVPWIVAAVVAATMYYQFHSHIVYGAIAFLVVADLIAGSDVGVLPIAYMVVVGCAMAIRHFIAFPDWSVRGGWRAVDIIQSSVVALLLTMMTEVLSVFIGNVMFSYGETAARVAVLFRVVGVAEVLLVCVFVLIILRRIEMPFRRAITFGI